MHEIRTQTCWIVAVDGKPTDIRGDSKLATRQAKLRKDAAPQSRVELHYGECSTRTYHNGEGLVVQISAPGLGDHTIIATVKEER